MPGTMVGIGNKMVTKTPSLWGLGLSKWLPTTYKLWGVVQREGFLGHPFGVLSLNSITSENPLLKLRFFCLKVLLLDREQMLGMG